MIPTNEAELFAEHQAAKKAAEEKAEAERQENYRKQELAERAKRHERERPVMEAIVKKIRAMNEKAELTNGRLWVNGVDVSFYIHIVEEYGSGSSVWRRKPTGRTRLSIGDYGSRQSYPQRKDGSFKWEAIANTLISLANRTNTRVRLEGHRKANESVVERVRSRLNVTGYALTSCPMSVSASSVPERPLMVEVKFTKAMTEAEAVALHHALKMVGLIKEERRG